VSGRRGDSAPAAGGASEAQAAGASCEIDQIRDEVLACPDVIALSAGAFGEARSYLPGRCVDGVRLNDDSVQVHVIARYGPSMESIADQIASALTGVLRDRRLDVVVQDVVLPDGAAGPSDEARVGAERRGGATVAGSSKPPPADPASARPGDRGRGSR
jgi:hypothetical protein